MSINPRTWAGWWLCAAWLLLWPAPPLRAAPEGAAPDQVLTLEGLIELAVRQNPDLAAAQAQAAAARGRLVQAGLYPNPTVGYQGSDLNHEGESAGGQGMVLSQQIVTAGKLRLAQAAAAHGVAAADWQVVTRWNNVVTRVRTTYFDVLTAAREVATNRTLLALAQEGLDNAQKLLDKGAGTQPDLLRARVERDQSRVRLEVARQREAAAWQLLAAAVGVPALPGDRLDGSLEAPAPAFTWQPLLETVLARSSEVQEAEAVVLQNERLLRRAEVEKVPNVQLTTQPVYYFPERRPRVQAQVGVMLPLFNRNQGNVAAAAADLERSRHEARLVELRLTERLAAAYQRYQSAVIQVEANRQILKDARESLRLVLVGYEKGDPKYDYTLVLQTQRTLAQAELANVQALGELWRAVSEIAGLLQLADPGAVSPRR